MNARFGSMSAALVAVALFSQAADAQIVSFRDPVFVAGSPPKCTPQGRLSIPDDGGTWRVAFDYGTIGDGKFTHDQTIGLGGIFDIPAKTTDGDWKSADQEVLKQTLTAWTTLRARLQKKDAKAKWVDQGNPSYKSLTGSPKDS